MESQSVYILACLTRIVEAAWEEASSLCGFLGLFTFSFGHVAFTKGNNLLADKANFVR